MDIFWSMTRKTFSRYSAILTHLDGLPPDDPSYETLKEDLRLLPGYPTSYNPVTDFIRPTLLEIVQVDQFTTPTTPTA